MTSIKIWVLLFSLQLLLQLSGDVELNPGPTGVFHEDELHGHSEGTEEEGKQGVWYMGTRMEEEEKENAAFVIQEGGAEAEDSGADIFISNEEGVEMYYSDSGDEIYFSDYSDSDFSEEGHSDGVIGGTDIMMPEFHRVTAKRPSKFEFVQVQDQTRHREVEARVRVEDAPAPFRRQPLEPFVRINMGRARHNTREFHNQMRNREIQRNAERIQVLADPVQRGDLTTTANVAAINRNADAMYHINRYQPTGARSRQGRTGDFAEMAVNNIFSGNRRRAHGGGGRRSRRLRTPAPTPCDYPSKGMDFANIVIDLLAYKDPSKPDFKIPVKTEPYLRANYIPEKHWTKKLQDDIEDHQKELVHMKRHEQLAFLKLLSESQAGEVGLQNEQRQSVSPEKMEYYKEHVQPFSTAKYKAKSAVAKEKNKGDRAAKRPPVRSATNPILDAIQDGVRATGLPLELPNDDITIDDGNCLFHALVSQLQRFDVQAEPKLKCLNHTQLRKDLCRFMLDAKDPRVQRFKADWNAVDTSTDYRKYWKKMEKDREWGDSNVIQAAAWYFERNIYVVSQDATKEIPIMFSAIGSPDGQKILWNGDDLWLGYYVGLHYQTLNWVADQQTVEGVQESSMEKFPEMQRQKVKKLPQNIEMIRELGFNYTTSMKDSIQSLYRPLMLRVGENVFSAKQEAGGKLCSVLSVSTAVLNIDTIREAASRSEGPIGSVLTRFTENLSDREKKRLIEQLAKEIGGQEEQQHREGRDAGDDMTNLLLGLFSEEGQDTSLINQHLETTTICPSCRRTRSLGRSFAVVDIKSAGQQQQTLERCPHHAGCRDGGTQQTHLLNSPDVVIQMVAGRRKTSTYNQIQQVPYEISSRAGAGYDLKFVLVHLGNNRKSGHFITLLSNPLDRGEALLVDQGEAMAIKREDFEEFAQKAYLIGYERKDPVSLPTPTPGDISTKTGEAIQRTKRRLDALDSLAFFKNVKKEIKFCRNIIEESYNPEDAKAELLEMLKRNTCKPAADQPLIEEEAVVRAQLNLHRHLSEYKEAPWSWFKRLKYKIGFYDRFCTIDRIKWFEEFMQDSKVRGTGPDFNLEEIYKDALPVEGGEEVAAQGVNTEPVLDANREPEEVIVIDEPEEVNEDGNPDITTAGDLGPDVEETEEIDADGSVILQCVFCRLKMHRDEMEQHREKGRCKVLRNLSRHFKLSPRNIASGTWSNARWTVKVMRPHDRGNVTCYTVMDKEEGSLFTCHIKTRSPIDLDPGHNRGEETANGFAWKGQGYSINDRHLVAVREEVMYKEVQGDQRASSFFPIWRLMASVWHIQEDKEEESEVNLDVHVHPAKDPANRHKQRELQLILVASDNGPAKKLVLRQPGKPDEELTSYQRLTRAEENLAVDERIFATLENQSIPVHGWLAKDQLLEFSWDIPPMHPASLKPGLPFSNPNTLCWINGTFNTVVYLIRPHLERILRAVMEKSSEFSGPRELVRIILDVLSNAGRRQSLERVRQFVAACPDVTMRQDRGGSALLSFETLIQTLHSQAPAAVESFQSIFSWSCAGGQCPSTGCDGTISSRSGTKTQCLLSFQHQKQFDDDSTQQTIDRMTQSRYLHCSKKCEVKVNKEVNIIRKPEIFVVTSNDRYVEQQHSMHVNYGGASYKAVAVVHHQEAGIGHHFCSLWDEQTDTWIKVNDYQPNWKEAYRFVTEERVHKVGSDRLFDNICFIVYKLETRHDNHQEVPEREREEEIMENVHKATVSGQQAFCSTNGCEQCYANSLMAMLFSSPHMHHVIRGWGGPESTPIEQFLQKMCQQQWNSNAPFPDMRDWRRLIYNEYVHKCIIGDPATVTSFHANQQQDAMEFANLIFSVFTTDDGQKNGEPFRAPISREHKQAFQDTLGFISTNRSRCLNVGCNKIKEETMPEFTLRVPIFGCSVNQSIQASMQPSEARGSIACDSCNKDNTLERIHTVSGVKKCLIVQLERFQYGQGFLSKNSRHVHIDEVLKVGPLDGYVLTGAVLHHGTSAHIGHYTHILRDVENGDWYQTDDRMCKKLDPETAKRIIGTQGYLLLYNKPDMPPPLKGRKRKRTLGDTPKRRWIPRVARRFFSMRESSSNFRACGDQPSGIVTVPHIPVRSSQPERRRAHYPSALELTNRLPVNSQNTQVMDQDEQLMSALRNTFKHQSFRSREQLLATKAVIRGDRDVMVVMSTGD